jgi:NTE family protein
MEKKPLIGIALDSGGAKGGAHMGVLDVFHENGIDVDIIAGSSAGAFAGAIYATKTRGVFMDILKDMKWQDALSFYVDPVFPVSSLLGGKRARAFLDRVLGDALIENLPISYAAVTTDLLSGDTVVLNKGSLADAVMASASMPGIFKPVAHGDRLLTDGGVSDPLPLDVLRSYNPDITIAVNLHASLTGRYGTAQRNDALIKAEAEQTDTGYEDVLYEWLLKVPTGQWLVDNVRPITRSLRKRIDPDANGKIDLIEKLRDQFNFNITSMIENSFSSGGKFMNIFDVLNSSTNIQQYQKNRLMLKYEKPDLLINPDVAAISSLEFTRTKEAIEEGRRCALEVLPELKALIEKMKQI